jgi:hypothetical protein
MALFAGEKGVRLATGGGDEFVKVCPGSLFVQLRLKVTIDLGVFGERTYRIARVRMQ